MEFCLYCVKIFLVTLYILIKFVDSIVNSRVKIKHNDQGFTKRFFDEKKYNVINENSVDFSAVSVFLTRFTFNYTACVTDQPLVLTNFLQTFF